MNELYLGQRMLFEIPVWMIAIALVAIIAGVKLLRSVDEGMGYYSSLSGEYGEILLAFCIVIGATAIQRGGSVPGGLGSYLFNEIALGAGILASIVWLGLVYYRDRVIGLWADNYHNSIVVMALVSLGLITILPVFFADGVATILEQTATGLLLMAYVSLNVYDGATGRHDPIGWFTSHKQWEDVCLRNAELNIAKAKAKTAKWRR